MATNEGSYKNAIAQLKQEEPLIKFIGQVELRNSRRVYYQEDSYRVEQINQKKTYSCDIPDKAVEYLYNKLKGHKVTPKDAFTVLDPVAKNFNLPYTELC